MMLLGAAVLLCGGVTAATVETWKPPWAAADLEPPPASRGAPAERVGVGTDESSRSSGSSRGADHGHDLGHASSELRRRRQLLQRRATLATNAVTGSAPSPPAATPDQLLCASLDYCNTPTCPNGAPAASPPADLHPHGPSCASTLVALNTTHPCAGTIQMSGSERGLMGNSPGESQLRTGVRAVMHAVEAFGSITNPSIDGLHLSFQYTCCYSKNELAVIATALQTVTWAPVEVTFTRIVCAASEFVALADPVAQGQLFGIVSAFEEAMMVAGLPVHRFRASQFAFHVSLFQPPHGGNLTRAAMLKAAQAAVPAGGLNRDKILIDSFQGFGQTFHATKQQLKTDDTDDAAPMPTMAARLNPPASSGTVTVLEIEQASIPAGASWFHLRSADGSAQMPDQILAGWTANSQMWFPRTAPKTGGAGPVGIQQYPFSASSMFNAGNVAEIVPCNLSSNITRTIRENSFIVEAWTDRNDLGDGSAATATLLASSASMAFAFDDKGFSHGLQFDNFRSVVLSFVNKMVVGGGCVGVGVV